MHNTIRTIGIGALLVVGIGGFVYWQKNAETASTIIDKDPVATAPLATTSAQTPAPTTQPGGITLATVATHNTRTSCWSTINGSVYDLTSWVPNHPGGEEAILKICGVDGSALFNGKHGGGAKQATVLAGFKIGTLVQ